MAVLESISDDDIKAIICALTREAKAGNLPAEKLLLSYVIGIPAPSMDPDRLATIVEENEADRITAQKRSCDNKRGPFDLLG